ncbi:hypothetical protein K525DRAFT_206789, partial [Schizophyllum commune Loenen D]
QYLYELVAKNEVPGLQRVISTAFKENVAVDGLIKRVEKAIDGEYHAKNYTANDIDIAMALYEFGGAGAVHAAHKSHLALPSLETIRRYRQDFSLRISALKAGLVADGGENIQTLFRPRDSVPRRLIGHGLATDEVSGDGRVCYVPKTDQIAGFCQEHVENLNSVEMGPDLTNSMEAARAVKEGKVHIGKEFTCAAILPHSRTDYGARPILLAPTCKRGLVSDSVQLLMSGIRSWQLSPYGERAHGPLWYLASDGDATRRNAMYKICMRRQLDPRGDLHRRLRGCVGLNLWVGLCTLLCSQHGLVVEGVFINKPLLSVWLEKLTDYDWSETSIHALLNPKDAQDVPRAIKLLSRVAELRHIDRETLTPSECVVHDSLSLLGEAFHSLLEPYINRTLSLSQQVTHLVKAAHLFCALYHTPTTKFISNQLYGDIQCMIKNAVFCVAKSQVLDPELEVFICLLGDDLLEALFGRVRMLGGHSPNVDISEMATRCRSALNLADIFRRHPGWERKPERLKLTRSRDFDHIGPREWQGNVVGKDCDLEKSWKDGAASATASLKERGITFDFAALFAVEGRDLMRPHGGNYPGVSQSAPDRSQAEDGDYGECEEEGEETDRTALSDHEGSASDVPAIESAITDAWTRQQARAPVAHSVWMKLDNCDRHKTSILREVFDLTHDIDYNKTHDRILRIHRFEIHDLFATLVRLRSGEVSLAIAQCTGIKSASGQLLAGAPRAELALADSTYTVSGQVMSLEPFRDDLNGEIRWAWDKSYLAFEPLKKRQSTTPLDAASVSKKGDLVLHTPAALIIPLLDEADSFEAPPRFPNGAEEPEGAGTWVLRQSTLVDLRERLWTRVSAPSSTLRTSIATYGVVLQGTFPYSSSFDPGGFSGDTMHISHRAGTIEMEGKLAPSLPCRVCGKQVSGPDRQTHMGRHIYLALHVGHDDSATKSSVSKPYPCGFCGGPSQTELQDGCTVAFGARKTAASTCQSAHPFMVKPAANMSHSKPCTNTPMRCRLCPMVQWKFNMTTHLRERHPGWETRAEIDSEFRHSLIISDEEAAILPSFGLPGGRGTVSASAPKKRAAPLPPALESTAKSPPTKKAKNT